jgi:hypothetical protein
MLKETSKSRKSSVGIVTRLRVAQQRNRVYYPNRRRRCFSSQRIQSGSWDNSASASVSAVSTLPVMKQPRPEAHHLPPCNAEVKNLVKPCQRYPIRPYALHADILSFNKRDRMAISWVVSQPVGLVPLVGLHGRLSEILTLEIRTLTLKWGKFRKCTYSEKTNVILGSGGTKCCDEMHGGMQNEKDGNSLITIAK